MDFSLISNTFITIFTTDVFFYCILGVVAGMVIGTLPGLSATMGIAILTPLTFWLEPAQGMAVLLGIYNSAIWAGGISAILINTPGTPASIAQTFDGYYMVTQGKVKKALNMNTIYSFIGGLIGTVVLIVFSFPVAEFALKFGPPEMFAMALFGLSMMIGVSGGSVFKGLLAGALGLLVSTIGMDPMTGALRFTFGNINMLSGIEFVVVMVGMFGVGEVLYQISKSSPADKEARKNAQIVSNTAEAFPTAKETKASVIPTLVCGAISAVIGAVPGTGGDIAAIICWQQTKNFSKHPEEFGKGAVNGLAVTSCANNAVIGGAMTTMMTLGIPGDGVTAVLIGSLMMYGMQPGPMMFVEKPEFVYNVMGLMVVGYIMILILGLLSTKFASLILKVPQEVIWVIVVGFCILGSYAVNNSMFDVYVMFAAGFVGFLCKRCEVPLGPFVLALLLGNLCESNFRRALSMSLGDYSIFLTRPITVVLLILTVLSLVLPAIGQLRKKSKAAK